MVAIGWSASTSHTQSWVHSDTQLYTQLQPYWYMIIWDMLRFVHLMSIIYSIFPAFGVYHIWAMVKIVFARFASTIVSFNFVLPVTCAWGYGVWTILDPSVCCQNMAYFPHKFGMVLSHFHRVLMYPVWWRRRWRRRRQRWWWWWWWWWW